MGANVCCLRNSGSHNSRPPPDQGSAKVTRRGTRATNIRSLLVAVKTRKKQNRQVNIINEEMPVCKNTCKVLTLEDLIASSPSFSRDEFNLHVPKQSSKKIHPSFDGDCKSQVQISMKVEETRNVEPEKSTKNRKLKKKVSFRSPEVAEIFVLDSPVIYAIGV